MRWARRGCLPGLILAGVILLLGVLAPRLGIDWPLQKLLAPLIAIGLAVMLFYWTSGSRGSDEDHNASRPDRPRGWTEEDQRRSERLRRKDRHPGRFDEDDEDKIRPDDFRR